MASPQLEDGHTRVANEIMEHIVMFNGNGTQFRILIFIWRYTYGFRRKEHEISISFISKGIGASKSQVDRELTALIDRNVVTVTRLDGNRRALGFNKDHTAWKAERCPRNGGQSESVLQLEDDASSKTRTKSYSIPRNKKERKKNLNKRLPRHTKKYDEDSTPYKMAAYFLKKISEMAAVEGLGHLVAKANLQQWADVFRKLLEIDKVEKRVAHKVMDWVVTDPFWRKNVLSAKTFREKFARLVLEMRSSGQKSTSSGNKQMTQNEQLLREIREDLQRDQNGSEEAVSHHQQLLPEFPD